MRAKGFDTSRHNHGAGALLPIDFQQAYDGGYSLWCGRLTVGDYYIDPWVVRDFAAASATPLVQLVYHVPRAGINVGRQIAKVQEALAQLVIPPAAIILDMEGEDGLYSPQQITACLGAHVSQLRAAIPGIVLILYSNLNYLKNVLLDTFGLLIWIAWPGQNGSMNPNDEPPVEDWILYQRSWTEAIPGVPDPTTDYDEFNGTVNEMLAFFDVEEIPGTASILENIAQVKTWLAQADALMDVIAWQAQHDPA